ncbi:MAG TPA: hypothetical protein VF840_07520 [Terriglobales bacterium]
MDETEQNNDKLAISKHSTPPSRWIGEQLTALAEAFGEALTPARLKLYTANLADIAQPQLTRAFGRAVRQLTFFPKVAELRKLADADDELRVHLEAETAWQAVERDLAGASKHARPHLDARTEYAIRCAGGRLGINAAFSASITDEAFTKKRFVEAFTNYEAAEHMGLAQLPAPLADKFRELVTGERKALPAVPRSQTKPPITKIAKPIPRPLSDAEVEARRDLLAKQAEELAARQ